jgi:hypothetical protein
LALREDEAERAAERKANRSVSFRSGSSSPKAGDSPKSRRRGKAAGLTVDVSSKTLGSGEDSPKSPKSPLSPLSPFALFKGSPVSSPFSVGLSLANTMGPKWRPVRGLLPALLLHFLMLVVVLGPATLAAWMMLDLPTEQVGSVVLKWSISWLVYLFVLDPVLSMLFAPCLRTRLGGRESAGDAYKVDGDDAGSAGSSEPVEELDSPTEEDGDDRYATTREITALHAAGGPPPKFYAGSRKAGLTPSRGQGTKGYTFKIRKEPADAAAGGSAKTSAKKTAASLHLGQKVPPGHSYLSPKEVRARKTVVAPAKDTAGRKTGKKGKKGKRGKKKIQPEEPDDGLREAERRAADALGQYDPVQTIYKAVTQGGTFKWRKEKDSGRWAVAALDDKDFDIAFAEKDRRRAERKAQERALEDSMYPDVVKRLELSPERAPSRQASRERAEAKAKEAQDRLKAVSFANLGDEQPGSIAELAQEGGDSSEYEYYTTSEDEKAAKAQRARQEAKREEIRRRKTAMHSRSVHDRVSFLKDAAAEKGRVELREDGRLRAVSYSGQSGAAAVKNRVTDTKELEERKQRRKVERRKKHAKRREEAHKKQMEDGAALLRRETGGWFVGPAPDEVAEDYSLPPGQEVEEDPNAMMPPGFTGEMTL